MYGLNSEGNTISLSYLLFPLICLFLQVLPDHIVKFFVYKEFNRLIILHIYNPILRQLAEEFV